jgi:hypothetical protein
MFSFFVKKDLNELKAVIDTSVVYTSKYFKDLKIEADASLSHYTHKAKTEEEKTELDLKRVDIIKKLVDLEVHCSQNQLVDLNKEKQYLQNEKNQLINKSLYLNKTIIFLDKNKCKNLFLFDRRNPVKLVILNNENLTNEKIDALKQK